jgi:ribosomal protein S18 acetylase RimI-like enzyme
METNKNIRKATVNDLNAILTIVEDARELSRALKSKQWLGEDNYPNAQTFNLDIAKGELYVYEINNLIAGFCATSFDPEPTYFKIYEGKWISNDQPYLVFHRLAVKKQFYGKGIGVELLKFAEYIARKNSILSIRLDTAKENQPMRKLVDKLNYKYCGLIKLGKYQGEEDSRLAFEKLI